MTRLRTSLGQTLLYAALAAVVGVFSHWPPYQHLAPDQAVIKLSIVHHGERLGDCVEQTPEELAKLPPNMRAPTRCPRERAPVSVEVDIDGQPAMQLTGQPSGLSRDGAAALYRRVRVPAGSHRIAVRLEDNPRQDGFDFAVEQNVDLKPAEILVIDFDSAEKRILLQ